MLLHLAGQAHAIPLRLARDLHGVVDRRQTMLGKLDIERRADDLCHAADVLSSGSLGSGSRWHMGFSLGMVAISFCILHCVRYSLSASAPPMISSSSPVIWPCRARL